MAPDLCANVTEIDKNELCFMSPMQILSYYCISDIDSHIEIDGAGSVPLLYTDMAHMQSQERSI